jgi:hypothetical protein
MDHDEVLAATRLGTLSEAIIMPAEDANGWVLLFVDTEGVPHGYTGHTGTEKVYHDLDHATEIAHELGFATVRVEERF